MSSLLSTADLLLRRPLTLLEHIREDRADLRELPVHLTVIAVVGFSVFGFLLGLTHSPLWGLVAAPKLVMVGLGTAALCLPALYVYGRLLGNAGTPLQVVCELLVALGTTGLSLLALSPVWLVFTRLVDHPPHGYFHVMLGTVAFLAAAGMRGAFVLVRALRADGRSALHLIAWTVLYGMVGLQASWTVRPFVGTPEDSTERLVLMRPLEKSAFDATATLLRSNARVLWGADVHRRPERAPWED